MIKDIFISYARKDLAQVEPIVAALEQHGWRPIIDKKAFLPGDTWPDEIQHALDSSRCVLVVWTCESVDLVKHEWRNGRPISYTRASNDSYVRSVAMIQSSGNSLDYLLHETIYSVAAPTDFHWEIDDYGVKLVDTTGADYHPSGEELILPNAGDHCRDQLLTNSKKRATLTKHDAFGDVRVSMQDSLEAGNCPAGSSRFAQTHGLDAHGYYSPELLLRISRPSEERQVRATIAVAVKNHQRMTDTGAMVFYPPPPMNVAQQIKMENVGCIPMTQ